MNWSNGMILEATFAALEASMPNEPAKTGDPKIDAVWSKFLGAVHSAIGNARAELRETEGKEGEG